VTPQGPFPPRGGPDDPGEGGHERGSNREPNGGGDEIPGPRGWVPPEDRLWRHPSELSSANPGVPGPDASAGAAPVPGAAARAGGRRIWTGGLLGVGGAAVVLAGIVLLNTVIGSTSGQGPRGGGPSIKTTDTWVAGAWGRGNLPAPAGDAERAMVSLLISTPHGSVTGCGVAVAEGGLVATDADTLVGATSVTATTAGGRSVKATVVGLDVTSDIALLRVPVALPVPRLDTTGGALSVGRPAMVVSLTRAPGLRTGGGDPATINVNWSVGTVTGLGATVPHGTAAGMSGIVATASDVPVLAGDVLVEPSGAVAGVLDRSGSTTAGTVVFLPTWLVVGVTDELASAGRVHHGWLGISGHDAPPASGQTVPGGALVVSVNPSGAASGALRVGDVIVSVNGVPVRTMAQLRSALYVLEPGMPVALQVLRGGVEATVDLSLAASP
jgi:S1-C subfamily serine protease